jgi:AcrR family transcriptional regulator
MRKRAETQESTRRRIIDATMRLHEEIGPPATTISAIAERAGVQRLTVYRHFPDESAVFQACTREWLRQNPPPAAEIWRSLSDRDARLRATLDAFYRYYRKTRRMWSAAHRDVGEVAALDRPMKEFAAGLAEIGRELSRGQVDGRRGKARFEATLVHALAFPTWNSLEELGLADAEKVSLVERWLAGVAS